ncbi:MAG: ABC transporter permease, partial [Candidatus Eremiobacteraeota bacterium]|nr:ABC transporter permease [Candidatus Eremiobacteraeota bacterium]
TATYVRMPFVCEGVLHGLVGSLVALLILGIGKAALWSKLALALPWLELNSAHVAVLPIALQLLAVGVAIGALSSWFSIGRYLRT